MLYRTKFSGQINDRKLRRDKNRFLSFSRMKEEDNHDDEADDSDSNSDDEKEDGGQGEHLERVVICTYAGNHSHGDAPSAQRLGCSAMIVTPVTTSELEWKRLERLGTIIVLVGDSHDEAQAYAVKRGEEEGHTFIPPFDHPAVIMGHGMVGMEIVHEMQGSLHAIFVPVGGGGLIAGIAAYVKMASPEDMYEEERTIVEPAGALELVGAEAYCKYHGLKDETVVAVTSGANMDSSTFRRVSLVANADGQGEAMLAIFLPQKPDSFERL